MADFLEQTAEGVLDGARRNGMTVRFYRWQVQNLLPMYILEFRCLQEICRSTSVASI